MAPSNETANDPIDRDALYQFGRTSGYAVFSLAALLYGVFWNRPADLNWTFFLIPFGISLPFFCAYSAIFHPRPTAVPLSPEDQRVERRSFVFFAIIGMLAAGAGVYSTASNPRWTPSPWLLIAVLGYSTVAFGNGVWLLWKYNPVGGLLLIRPQVAGRRRHRKPMKSSLPG